MTILVDHDPQDPQSRGRTTGLLLLEGLTHFDVKCTDGKLRFNVGFTFDDGKPKSIRFAPVPERLRGGFPDIRPGHKKELVTLWETELGPPKEKKKKRKPKRRLLRGVFRSTDKPWWRIPIRPRYLQDPPLPAMKRDRARLSQAASRMEASILVSQRRWSHDERAHTTMIAQALKSAGIVVAPMEGAAWVYPPFPARRSVELEMNLNGSGILTDPLGPPCPWQLVIDLDPMSSRTWVTYAVTVDAISAARHAAVSASGLLAVKASGNDSPRENHAAAGVFKSILPEGHRPGAMTTGPRVTLRSVLPRRSAAAPPFVRSSAARRRWGRVTPGLRIGAAIRTSTNCSSSCVPGRPPSVFAQSMPLLPARHRSARSRMPS
jgi:hypothetical protein